MCIDEWVVLAAGHVWRVRLTLAQSTLGRRPQIGQAHMVNTNQRVHCTNQDRDEPATLSKSPRRAAMLMSLRAATAQVRVLVADLLSQSARCHVDHAVAQATCIAVGKTQLGPVLGTAQHVSTACTPAPPWRSIRLSGTLASNVLLAGD